MSDILERAEALCGDTYRYEETTEDTDGTLRNLVDRANILPELIAECKRQQAEAAQWQAVFQPGDERCLKAVIWLVRGVLGPKTVSDELSCLLRLQKAALGSKPRAWLMTGGRIKAMYSVLRFGTQMLPCEEDEYNVLLTMLEEAKQ